MKAKHDMTKGSVTRAILLFALPIFLGNIFQQAYNLADTAIAGHFLGDDALSAIGASTSLYNFLMYFIGGLNGGFSLVVARFFGEGNKEKMKNSIATMVVINAIFVLIAMLIGVAFLKPILLLLNTPQEILGNSLSYISIIYFGVGITACYNAQANLLRAMGNSVTPIIFLVVSSGCNICLDALFISKLHFGIKGAAMATVISQLVSVILCQIVIIRSYREYKTSKENYRYNKEMYNEMFVAGITMALMNCIFALGSLIQQGAINSFGKTIIAGHLAARRIIELFMQPMITVSTACSTFVSQNYGAGELDRIKKALKSSAVAELAMAVVFTAVVYAFCTPMIKAVTSTASQEIVSTARMYLRINTPCFIALGILYLLRTSIQSLGKRIPPLLSSAIELVVKIFGAFVLARQFGYRGVCFAEPSSWVLGAILLVFTFIPALKQATKKTV